MKLLSLRFWRKPAPETCGKPQSRIFGPMLTPRHTTIQTSYQLSLFVPPPKGTYVPRWTLEHRLLTNVDSQVFVPPTVIQVKLAKERIERRMKGAPYANSRTIGALQLFLHGYNGQQVFEYVYAGLALALCVRFVRLARKRVPVRKLIRRLQVEHRLTCQAPRSALKACHAHLNGF